MSAPTCAGPDPDPKRPITPVPDGACDSHVHLFGPVSRYPWSPNRTYTPPESPLAAYRHLMSRLGLTRVGLVQSTEYGNDNSATLDGVEALGQDHARAIVMLDMDSVTDEELAALARRGAVGLRHNLLRGDPQAVAAAPRVAERIAPFGWHMQFTGTSRSAFELLLPRIHEFRIPVVLSRFGIHAADMDPAEVRLALDLFKSGNVWIKLSHTYLASSEMPPYPNLRRLADQLIEAAPDRLVWGTDWPHAESPRFIPNDGDLIDALAVWVPDEPVRRRILVDNPGVLYGFAPVRPA